MINEKAIATYGIYGASSGSTRACLLATYGLLDDLPESGTPALSVISFSFAARPTFSFAARPTFSFAARPGVYTFKKGSCS